MSDVQLGTEPKMIDLLEKSMDYRDAVHVAVVPMRSPRFVRTGEPVKVLSEGKCRPIHPGEKPDGIVDPFLPRRREVLSGTWFWVLLMPGTVTGMRNHWHHPVFDGFQAPEVTDSPAEKPTHTTTAPQIPEAILEIAEICGKTYDELMADARQYAEDGVGPMDNSQRYENVSSSQWEIFWDYFSKVEGKEPPDPWAPYHCAC